MFGEDPVRGFISIPIGPTFRLFFTYDFRYATDKNKKY